MTVIVPNVGEVAIAQRILDQVLTLKLYSNNIVPDENVTANSFIEVTGGGYSSIILAYANWIISENGVCTYPGYNFRFTGATSGPGTVYGYYIVNPAGVLLWAERFPTGVLPFTAGLYTLIRVEPKIQVA